MKNRIYVTSYDMVERVEQMLRNTGKLADWDLVDMIGVKGGYRLTWRLR